MKLAAEADAIRRQVDELALAGASIAEWRTADARLFTALVEASIELGDLRGEMCKLVRTSKPNWTWFQTHAAMRELLELVEELRVLRMCVQSQILELESGPQPRASA